ncbi:MAG: hypothetical protein A3E77_09290 [Sphingopyxis sp. RIFCSPHIGHO2_12_FULL_65_19]|nr:MAG: hypothetical protein A3E77_09290 [Sphingopyxis sp. RIFCSPHIGHO2_12_FULL_65_19]
MPEVDPLVLRLIADTRAAREEMRRFQRESGQGLDRVGRDVTRLENQIRRSSGAIGASLRGLAATFATLFTGRELVAAIDSFTRLQNSLKVAGLEGEKLQRVQSQLLDLSSRYGVGIEGLANLYGKAADAGRSFGASEGEILQLTEATSQALKITGTSAAQAQGAILGLSQALASGTVRAEEYSQINEGGLRPLLQAAAGAERFGGDINKLRAAMLDGKVTSQEFFAGIIAGSAELDAKAAKATLTLAGAFEALSSRFTVYIGQSAEANGATAALAGAMQLLAENLDIIIPALATIAAVMGGTMVANAIAGSRAFFALTAAMGGAATAAEAATFAFGGLGAALAGPVGVAAAITAVGAGLIYLASQSENTGLSIDDLREANEQNAAELDGMISKLKAAGVQTDELAAAAARAKGSVDDLSDSYRNALIEARKFNKETAGGKIQQYNDDIRASQDRQAVLTEYIRAQRAANPGAIREGRKSPQLVQAEQKLAGERQFEAGLRVRVDVQAAAFQAGVDLDGGGKRTATATGDKPKGTRTSRTRAAEDPLDAQFRNEQELRQLQLEELRAKEQVATSAKERASFARDALDLEATMRRKDIDEAQRKGQLLEGEANARRKIIDNLYGAADEITVQGRETAYQLAISREEQERLARQQNDAMRDELDALGAEAGITDVRKNRVAIERRMLEIQQQIERSLLDEAIARGDVLDAAQARGALARKQTAERIDFDRGQAGALGQYIDDLRKQGLNLDDQFEGIAANGLRSLNDGLADAIANSKNLGDVFKNVAQSIIADLIRIAIQQTIVNALMNVAGSIFGGGFTGDGAPGNAGGMDLRGFRAGGGPVAAGSLYRINETATPGNPEYFRPWTNGEVIPLGQVNKMAARGGAQGNGIATVRVELSGDLDARIVNVSGPVAVEVVSQAARPLIDAAANETMRRANRPRMPGAGR